MPSIFLVIAAGIVGALCYVAYLAGRKAQAAEDFDAIVSMIRVEPADETEQESNHYGV